MSGKSGKNRISFYTECQTRRWFSLKRTALRIATGFSALGALAWMLWPNDWGVLADGEAPYAFLTALVIWLAAEISFGEPKEIAAINAPIVSTPTENDLKRAREIAGYRKAQLRILLRDHDFGAGINPRYVSEAIALIYDLEEKIFFFNNKSLQLLLDDFSNKFGDFVDHVVQHGGADKFGSVWLNSFFTPHTKQIYPVPDYIQDAISKANRMATEAWEPFDKLYDAIREEIPEAFDREIEVVWRASDNLRD